MVMRLLTGPDLKLGLENVISEKLINSGILILTVESLNKAVLRMSNGDIKKFYGYFEIVSAEGTLSSDGIHVQLSLADEKGRVYGGHLCPGCIVHTTAEIGILESKKVFKRVFDPKTGYKELQIEKN